MPRRRAGSRIPGRSSPRRCCLPQDANSAAPKPREISAVGFCWTPLRVPGPVVCKTKRGKTMRKILQTEDFLLGTFASNCSGGMTVTKLPERWAATWDNNEQLGRLLDDAGIDFMLPIARWIGYG